jgi:CHAD domain-containing protein
MAGKRNPRIPINRNGREITASASLRRYLRQMQGSLDSRIEALSRSATPVAVHDCRTQARRLSAILRTFRHAFDTAELTRYENALRHLTRDLGPARNADVARQIIERLAEDQCNPREDGLEELRTIAAHARSLAVRDLKARMIHKAWLRRLEQLRRAASNPALIIKSQVPMAVMAARVLRRRRRRLRRQLRAHERSAKALHKLRLKVKTLRYVLECVTPQNAAVRAEMKQLRLLQNCLGEFHDEWDLRRRLAHQRRYFRANIDIRSRLCGHREELLRSIESHQDHLLRIWKQAPAERIRDLRTAAAA